MGSLIEPKGVEKEDAEGRDQLLGTAAEKDTHTERGGGRERYRKRKRKRKRKKREKWVGFHFLTEQGAASPVCRLHVQW